MNWDQISGQWKQFKGKAKEKWGKLTDDEIDVVEGQEEPTPEEHERRCPDGDDIFHRAARGTVGRARPEAEAAPAWCA